MSGMNAADLADLIEAGLAAETLVEKQQLLPSAGKKDRRVLFEAIAEAVLTYLKAQQGDLKLHLSGSITGTVEVLAPSVAATAGASGTVHVTGAGFTSGGSVDIRWIEDSGGPATAAVDGTGKFSAAVSAPQPLRDGNPHFLDVRDHQGQAALASVTPT